MFNKISNELESFHTAKIEYLKQPIIDDKVLSESNEEAANLINKAELEMENRPDHL